VFGWWQHDRYNDGDVLANNYSSTELWITLRKDF